MKKIGLLPRLIIGIILGILIGIISKAVGHNEVARVFVTFSSIFGSFLNFIVPCIIIGFVVPGIAELGKKSGKLLVMTTIMAYVSTIGAGLLAFFVGISILPNIIKAGELVEKSNIEVAPFFTLEIPPVMGVMTALVLSFLLGLGIANIKSKDLYNAIVDFKQIIILTVKNVIIPLVPVYITGIFIKLTIAGDIFRTLKAFSSIYLILLILQVIYLIIQYTVVWAVSGKLPHKCLKNMLPAYFTAVGTQSSAATIPVTLQCARKNGVPDEIVDFVIPLCATIHLAGDTITLVLASMGVMLMSGQQVSFAIIFPFILMLGITMIAAPGIPGGGVVSALGLLQDMLMFNTAQQGLMFALHAAQDSFGTATNVTGDGAIAVIVDCIANKKYKVSVKNGQPLEQNA